MNDVERDLRELFDRKASSVGGVVPRLPDRVRKRSRRRELGTALVSGLTALALIVGSVAVVRSLDVGENDRTAVDDPWAGYQVFERTATVGNFAITSPSDWYLVNQWPWASREASRFRDRNDRAFEACRVEPTRDERRACRQALPLGEPGDGWVAPIAMLSLRDHGLTSSPCFDPSFRVGAEDAVMTIALDRVYMAADFGAGDLPRWPVPFDETAAPYNRPSCGPGTYVPFAAGDVPYVAHFAFGAEVRDEQRQTLIDAFGSMTIDDSVEVLMDEPEPSDSGAYVIAGGENAAGPWTLQLRPQTDPGYVTNVQLELTTVEGRGAVAGGPFTLAEDDPIEQAGGDPVFGAVGKEATGVEIQLEDGTPPIPAQIVPLPPSMPFGFDLFFASNDADVQAAAIAIGPDDTELPAERSGPTGAPARDLLATGDTAATPWTLEYVPGIQLALVGPKAEILDAVSGNLFASFGADNPLVMGSHDFGSRHAPHYFLFGLAQPELGQVSIMLADGTEIPLSPASSDNTALLGPGDAPWAWWVELPSGPIAARITAFDDRCERMHVSSLILQASTEYEGPEATCVLSVESSSG